MSIRALLVRGNLAALHHPTAARRDTTASRRHLAGATTHPPAHPVLLYVVLTLLLSWAGFLLAGGAGLLTGSDWETDPGFGTAIGAMVAGPLIAGLLLTRWLAGMAGVRLLVTRLVTWRVAWRWYAIALLTAPVLDLAVLLGLSWLSPEFAPAIASADARTELVLAGLAVGVAAGLAEEIGWTGFATPLLRQRFGIVATGLILGPVWALWRLLEMLWVGRLSADTLPLSLYLPLSILASVAVLSAYRVLIVWVYDRTVSLLLATLMHASYVVTTLAVFAPPDEGVPYLLFSGAFAATLWGLVGVIGMSGGFRDPQRPPH